MAPRLVRTFASIVAGVAVLAAAPAALAQCSNAWLPGTSAPGVRGTVYATAVWDPDGAGPLGPRQVLGGAFSTTLPFVTGLVAFDPASRSWSAVGISPTGTVRAIATLPNGHLVVGGEFMNSFGVAANGVAEWDGIAWHALGTGTNGPVHALTVLANGELVAGGAFTTAGGSGAGNLARWDGAAWQSLGFTGTVAVGALLVQPNGDLIVGSDRVQRWNGASWQLLGIASTVWSPFPNQPGSIGAMATLANGDFVATGVFDLIQGVAATNIARWDGTAWQPLGTGIGQPMAFLGGSALAVSTNGDLVVGGLFAVAGGTAVNSLARWDGALWHAVGGGAAVRVFALTALPGGELLIGGTFTTIGGIAADYVARWDGQLWHTLGEGLNGSVYALVQLPGGDLVIGGGFTNLGGLAARGIARWNGSTWQSLGTGMDEAVLAMAVLPNGELVAAGGFHTAGGVATEGVARWDGAAWHPLGPGLGGEVMALTVLPNGELVAGGLFQSSGPVAMNRIARWDGVAWQPFGAGMTYAVHALGAMANGDLVAGGFFSHAGGVPTNSIARWDGTQWQPFGTGVHGGPVEDFALLPNGDLVAAGAFTTAGGVAARCVARWDGTSWHPFGPGTAGGGLLFPLVKCLRILPNGDLAAGGDFTSLGGVSASFLARWNGALWQPLGGGTAGGVHALLQVANGDLAIGGTFSSPGAGASTYLARLTTTCLATVNTLPTPCVGPVGALTLVADNLPWTGATFRSTATGFATNALGVSVLGFLSPGLPLSMVLPAALPNCPLLASGDAIVLTLPTGGVSGYQFDLPNDAGFAGLQLFHQLLQLELDAQGHIVTSSGSNGLALVVGAF